jgi:hypothetical protein
MAAVKLSSTVQSVPIYAVIGSYRSNSTRYLGHLSLHAEEGTLKFDAEANIFDMKPPLRLGHLRANGDRSEAGRVNAHVVGWIDLEPDQRDGIMDWLSNLKGRFAGRALPASNSYGHFLEESHYSIHPPFRVSMKEPTTGTAIYECFSCVGFVLACYQIGAGVELLVDADSGRLPLVGLSTIRRVYGETEARLVQRYAPQLRLKGTGPWPLVFPGYVLHSLSDSSIMANMGQPHAPRFREIQFT